MRNYQESDYALNKYSEGIVYKFADGRTETVWLEDYLEANPDKTAEDFARLKTFSDNEYHEQIIVDNRTGRLDVTINELEGTMQLSTEAIDVELIRKHDEKSAIAATKQLLESHSLTEIQRRRFVLHYFRGLSTRQIADIEGVNQSSVVRALQYAQGKLKKIFDRL